MDGLIATTTIALAVATGVLAFVTWRLAAHTSTMVAATQDMASSTNGMLELEQARRAEETAAFLQANDRRPSGSLYEFENLGGGPARDIEIHYARPGLGAVAKQPLAPQGYVWTLDDSDFVYEAAQHPELEPDLPAPTGEEVFIRLRWLDSLGEHRSGIFAWERQLWTSPALHADR